MTIPALLDHAIDYHPAHGIGFVYPDHSVRFIYFPDLKQRALGILSGLQQQGLGKGSRVILSLETNEELIPALWACFYGGIVPALLQPPISFSEYNPAAEKAAKVFALLDPCHVILSHAHAQSWQSSNIPAQNLLDIADISGIATQASPVSAEPGDLALIQFSSGSTGDPKGVMLTHGNIFANITDIIKGIQLDSQDVAVNWMPLYHDMGLVGFHITPVLAGVTQYFINPVDFVKNPFLWLDTMSRKKCTITACPNFGQVLVNRHLSRKTPHHWDLSPVRILFNGAEPISVSTMRNFLEGLSPHGLNPVAMFPAYGLAEATLAVTFPDRLSEAEIRTFDRQRLLREGVAAELLPGDPQGIELVNLGVHLDHCDLMVTSDAYQSVGPAVVGNILVKGDNITKGYFGNPDKSSASFFHDWLITGDLGFVHHQSLFITGRSKDIIFINGTNYYAHDLETIALQVDGIAYGKIVIAGNFDESESRDKLLIFIVGANNDDTRFLCQKIKNHFSNMMGLTVETFIPVRSSDIPRTSSGKLQRYKLVGRYLKNDFSESLQF